MTRFTEYQPVAEAGGVTLVWRHDLIAASGEVLATNRPEDFGVDSIRWGAEVDTIKVDRDRVSERTATLAFPVGSETIGLLPRESTDPLHPDTGSTVEIWAGFYQADGEISWHQQGTMSVATPDAELLGAGVGDAQVALVDATGPLRGELLTHFSVQAGESVSDVVDRLLDDVLPSGSYVIPDIGYTTEAGEAEAGADRFELINELLEGCGWELIADPAGLVTAREILPAGDSATAERWVYGDNGIPVDAIAPRWDGSPIRGWRGEGGGEPQEVVTVWDLDPSSASRFRGLGTAARVLSSEWPFAGDPNQLRAACYAQLRRHGSGPGEITIHTIPNPAIRQGDLVDLDLVVVERSGSYRVTGYELPLQVEDLMAIHLRRVWDPDLATRPSDDPDPDGISSHSDDFDRSDQNLEIRAGQAGGSSQWIEFGFSWWVIAGQAVQWFADGWSLAARRQPLIQSDHFAEVTVRRIPAGRAVGPAVRCSGTARDGYVAMARNGSISLEVWVGDRLVSVLKSKTVKGTMVGRSIRVEAEGSTVRVKLDGSTVIEKTDSRLKGRYVGMMGYGGAGNASPAVQPFAAGALA